MAGIIIVPIDSKDSNDSNDSNGGGGGGDGGDNDRNSHNPERHRNTNVTCMRLIFKVKLDSPRIIQNSW